MVDFRIKSGQYPVKKPVVSEFLPQNRGADIGMIYLRVKIGLKYPRFWCL
jgi:hypothetical protein